MKRILFLILAALAIGGLYGIYLYTKKPLDTREQKADFELNSKDLIKEFSTDETLASKKYIDKILIVSGVVGEINLSSNTIFLESDDPLSAVTCSFYTDESNQLKELKTGKPVRVKGKCTGKLSDVVLNNCSLYPK